ncbi:hypothetical protein EW145_g8007 [Phellinidium pouzarii]|uniref:Uncharacterized protein n=1 Tax=Phellinidium pouzarii TaxID=167371 RepID=A0A4S4KC18_9AGAM|nr:hypothetical protein EW145_g8007 [Phellinidium pouzarii]
MLTMLSSAALLAGVLAIVQSTRALHTTTPSPPQKRGTVAFFNPANGGGSMLDNAGDGLGEPLNVIISGLSSSDVLTDDGFLNFAQSLGLSFECLGLHLGAPQSADLGDGNGFVNQTTELRQDYGNAELGTCLETLIGGNHLRYVVALLSPLLSSSLLSDSLYFTPNLPPLYPQRVFRQNGTDADSGALFLAVSKEEDLEESHTIVPDGYDIGRDTLVSTAIAGQTSFGGVTYSTTAENVTGLLPVGSSGVNHGIALDGIVTLLTVTIV